MLKRLGGFAAFAGCLALLLAFTARPAAAQGVDDIIKRGRILVGMDVANPPFGSLGTDGQPQGYDADVARLAVKYLGGIGGEQPEMAPSPLGTLPVL